MAEQLHLRNLSVPFFSQRKNTYLQGTESMASSSCNITCIAMLLHYFGITTDTPDAMMKKFFVTHKLLNNTHWSEMKKFVDLEYNKEGDNLETKFYDDPLCTIKDLKENIAAGYPTMMSLGIDTELGRQDKRDEKKVPGSGHIVVVRGFTKIGSVEYIILNDPWGSPADINNELAPGYKQFAYYSTWANNDDSNGDNIVLKVTEFENMIKDDKSIHAAMVIRALLWQKPNGTEIGDTNALFPMNSDFMWHSGIHLSDFKTQLDESTNEVRSIGTGRLLAVRNSDAINGSASFMLVKHQVAKLEGTNAGSKVGKILPFYALYMHTDSIDIKACAQTYFKTGKLPDAYNFKWLLQLFSNMLPHVRVISRTVTAQPIYKAYIIVGGGLRHTDATGNMILASAEFHGVRMLVHLLPVGELFDQLLDPANYANPSFRLDMLKPSKFVKTVTIGGNTTKYIFFHSYDASTDAGESGIFCSKFVDGDGDTGFFEKPTTVNGSMFTRNAKILSMLHNSEEVVSLNDLVNFPVTIGVSAKAFLNGRANNFTFEDAEDVDRFADLSKTTFLNKQKAHWNEIFTNRIITIKDDNTLSYTANALSLTDKFFDAVDDISSYFALLPVDTANSKDNIYMKLKKYFTRYKNARYAELVSFLKNRVIMTNEPTVPITQFTNTTKKNWRDHLVTILKDCFSKIKTECRIDDAKVLFEDVDLPNDNGADIANSFVNSLKGLDLSPGYAEIAMEIACCSLCSIPKNKITDADYFKVSDKTINALLESYSDFLYADFNSFQIYQHYVDTVIEIPKNDIIGKCGRYNDEMDMIHFEIFSAKGVNIYTELGIDNAGLIEDESTDDFFNASHTVEKLKEYLPQEFDFLNVNIIRYYEFNQLKENNILSKYAVKHISEWSPTLTYEKFKAKHPIRSLGWLNASIRKDGAITSFDSSVDFKDEYFGVEEYFKQCSVPYQWSLKTIVGKKTSTDDFHIYYHPTEFLKQLIGKDEESLDLHEPDDE